MSSDARRYLIAVLLLVGLAGTAEAVRLTRVPPANYHPTFENVPREIGAYKGTDLPRDESIYNFLNAQGLLERRYDGPGAPIAMSVLYAPDWRSIHSPEGCFPAQGWTVLEERVMTLQSAAGPLQAKMVRLKKDEMYLLAMFSFGYPGGTTADWTQEGYKVALGRRGEGGVVFTVSTQAAGQEPEAAVKHLSELMQVAYPAAIAFWNKK